MKKLAVIGPGLLGGSIALAWQQHPGWRVALWARRPEAVRELQELQIAEECSTDLKAMATDADIIVLCVPIGAMPGLARELSSIIPAGCLVTDVGSVKGPVVAELAEIFRERGRFVGSHPMAGSERTGIRAARADLFEGSVCMVTPTGGTLPSAAEDAAVFWSQLGCRVHEISPAAHDEAVALISHLPHAVAAALVNTVADRQPGAFAFIGPGFRDTSRVASGPPEMWAEIVQQNRVAVRQSVEAMIEKLRAFSTLLDRSEPGPDTEMKEFFTQAKVVRDQLRLPLH